MGGADACDAFEDSTGGAEGSVKYCDCDRLYCLGETGDDASVVCIVAMVLLNNII